MLAKNVCRPDSSRVVSEKHGFRYYVKKGVKSWQLYVLILPAVIYFVVFHFWPIYGLQIAFRAYKPKLGIAGSPWVGLEHFVRFATGPNFLRLMSNTLRISIGNLLLGFPIPILLALVINEIQSHSYKKTVQTVSYAPHFISLVVMVSMLRIFLNVNTGIINKLLGAIGAGPHDFLSKGPWFASIYVFSSIWQSAGWGTIVYLAALSGVDASQTEAAMVDGASRIQRIWHVNLPAIMPTIIIMFILDSGKIMSVGYEKAYLMQTPLNLEHSEIISTYVYKTGLLNTQYSFSAAVGLFNSFINFILLLSVNAISRKVSSTGVF